MLNLDNVKSIEYRKFCGLVAEQGDDYVTMCVNVAVGEFTADVDGEGTMVTLPVCQEHHDLITYAREKFSLGLDTTE